MQLELNMRRRLTVISGNPNAPKELRGLWRYSAVRQNPESLVGGCKLYDIGTRPDPEAIRKIIDRQHMTDWRDRG